MFVLFDNVVIPDTFNDDNNVVLFNVVVPETFNVLFIEFKNDVEVVFKLVIYVDKWFKLVVKFDNDVVCELIVNNVDVENVENVVFVIYGVKSGLFVIAL